MRRGDEQQGAVWITISPEQCVPQDHPLRPIRETVNVVLKDMSPSFSRIYAREARPSILPERLLRALLLQVLSSVRSERMLMKQRNYNLLFRWFVGLNMDNAVWSPTTFSNNRERVIDAAIADKCFERVQILAREAGLLSDEHFTRDGTLIEAWRAARASSRRSQRTMTPTIRAIRRSTSTVRYAPTARTNRRPILRRGCTGSRAGQSRSCASRAT